MWIPLLLGLLLAGCATVESDRSSFDVAAVSRTRMDYAPLNRNDRDRFLQLERQELEKNATPLQKEFDAVAAERARRFDEIKGQFPDCQNQKHCLSALAFRSEKDFERYNGMVRELQVYDRKLIDLEAELRGWRARYDLRSRAIYNRFLVYEFLQLPQADRRIVKLEAQSLEAFDTRRALSERLLQSGGMMAATWGDLNFSMFGRPLDEAATIATIRVELLKFVNGKTASDEFMITVLFNGQDFDHLEYDRGLLNYWAAKLIEPKQLGYRRMALCSLYAVGGETLVARLPAAKAETCATARARLQAKFRPGLAPAEDWILPLGYFRAAAATEH